MSLLPCRPGRDRCDGENQPAAIADKLCAHAAFRMDAGASFLAYRPLVYSRRFGVPDGLPEITPVVELLINQVRTVL